MEWRVPDGFSDQWLQTNQEQQISASVDSTGRSPRQASDGELGPMARAEHPERWGRQREVESTAPRSPMFLASPRRPRTVYPRGRCHKIRMTTEARMGRIGENHLTLAPVCGATCGLPGSTSQERSLQHRVRKQVADGRGATQHDPRPGRSVRVAMTEGGRSRTHLDGEKGS